MLAGAAAAGGGLAALSLAGCGGGKSSSEGSGAATQGNGLLTTAVDTSKSAKPGGTYKSWTAADARGFDPHVNITATSADVIDHVYSRLTMFAPGLNGAFPDGTLQ
ncbi:MAG TPA: hypothetical protein VH951_12290, partial [Dehalococcoidia bacterium]